MKGEQSPDKIRPVLNVGITGHRELPDADMKVLTDRINDILRVIESSANGACEKAKDFFNGDSIKFRIISSLAEGCDRIVAKCALTAGFDLECPLPFKRAEYEKDFLSDESLEEFRDLLKKAEAVFEIAYNNNLRSKAYLDAGQIMLGQSDVLIAVWNGKESERIGGTGDIVDKAVQQDIPIIWINSSKPHDISLIYGGKTISSWHSELEKRIVSILLPWRFDSNNPDASLLEQYLKERKIDRNFAFIYSFFTNIVSSKGSKKIRTKTKDYDMAAEDDWNSMWKNVPDIDANLKKFIKEKYVHHYAWADNLSMYYADHFRSAGILRQLLPFLAAVGLMIGFYWGWVTTSIVNAIGFGLQALFLSLIIILSMINNKNKWHQRFTDYRLLAELIRQMVYLAPLGIGIRDVRISPYNKQADVSWVKWYFRGIVREAGLPDIVFDINSMNVCRKLLKESVVENQIAYHKSNSNKMGIISRRLEKFGLTFYYIGLLVIILRVGVHFLIESNKNVVYSIWSIPLKTFANFLTMAVPAVATTAFGISAQCGFEGIRQRSYSMADRLKEMEEKIAATEIKSYTEIKNLAEKSADLMISEFSDWRVFVRTKSISGH